MLADVNELKRLLELSACLGRNRLLTQGAAGNTSIKAGEDLWIKASGKRLSDAEYENILHPVRLATVRRWVHQDISEPLAFEGAIPNLRPSIEAGMHAVLSHKVVVHLHSIHTLAYAVRADAPKRLEELLEGLPWAWVPYVPSGIALARRIECVLAEGHEPQVLILGNHGLVIGGRSCDEVQRLLDAVERRLATACRRPRRFDDGFLKRLGGERGWRMPENSIVHSLATDPVSRGLLRKGCLFPSQAAYLGGSYAWQAFPAGSEPDNCMIDSLRFNGVPFVVIENKGVLVWQDISNSQMETLEGLAELVQRIPWGAPIRYLTQAECKEASADLAHFRRSEDTRVGLSA